ncbi:MAG TPA: type II toxin-antitoxin system VapC family toxin [Aurantimonas coralicida]|uniref:Type II toxin-antitoxin system VapC family toxin n=2 Tax=root TaxID=1 RepID=A0A9C9TJY1_9HYPH|nr:type II toxin-antitoxin system VapC family toxin [Aurantimonas coralicida]HEU03333.1 type II toxin-antitoxin system VapC family toxin [Aurantimonas coralicida]
MATVCDTNILIDLYGRAQAWHEWSVERIADLRRQGRLVINPLIFAEFSVGYRSEADVRAVLEPALFDYDRLPWNAAHPAGKAFLAYRRDGGEKRSPLPDFYIGAHALVRGHRLLTRDASRYRSYFPDLEIISPETHP